MDNFALIVGAAKSGTTSLFHYLAEHPEISGCSIKEPHFFTDEEKLSKGFDWYRQLWTWDPASHKVALEASTGYTKLPYFPNAAERIAEAPAQFKFIYVMRNPLERIESHYGHGQISQWETSQFQWNDGKVGDDLINVSSYAKQISEYYRRFPAERIKLVVFEDLVENRAGILRDICAFLEIDPDFEFQTADRSYNQASDRLTSPFLRRLNRSAPARRLKTILPYQMKREIKRALIGKEQEKYTLSPEVRERTLDSLRSDLEKLRQDYGVDIRRWGLDI